MKKQILRPAFSMLTAIFVIVIMASVGAMVMSLSGKIVKETTTQYQREQAMLLAKSYTEYAIMAVMANSNRNTAGECLDTIHSDNVIRAEANGGYDVDVQISYIASGGVVGGCANILSNTVATVNSPLNIIIDVYVRYQDFDVATQIITYHKRTLQKI